MQVADLKAYHLSVQQTYLWSVQGLNPSYRAQCMVMIEGQLDFSRFWSALQKLLDQHDILRTAFICLPGTEIPVQIVTDDAEAICPFIDLGGLVASMQERQLDACFNALLAEPLELDYDSLLHVSVLRCALDRHVMLVSLPALCADTSTLQTLVSDLIQRLGAFHSQDDDLDQSDDAFQYVDVAAWQRQLLASEEAQRQRREWQQLELAGLASIPPIWREADANWQRDEPFEPRSIQITLDAALQEGVQRVSQQYSIPVASWLLACWHALFWRLGNGAACDIGVTCDGRNYAELAGALGLYARVVPIEVPVFTTLPFEQVSRLVNTAWQEIRKKQAYFSWDLLEQPEQPFSPLSFASASCPQMSRDAQIAAHWQRLWVCTEPFALKLTCLEQGENVSLTLHYNPRMIVPARATELAAMFRALLRSTVERPTAQISALPLLSDTEQAHLLQLSTGLTRPLPTLALHELFEAQVEQVPQRQAVLSATACLSYAELNGQANQLARLLRRMGVGPDVVVGIAMPRSTAMLLGMLAILKAGGAYLPIDVEYPEERLLYQLRDARVSLLLTQNALIARLPEWNGQVLCLEKLAEELAQEDTGNLPSFTDPHHLAYVIYTSGSTGEPKGVMIQHGSVVNYTRALCDLLRLQPSDELQFATVSTLAADLGNTMIFCALASGGCLHVLDYETITSARAFADWTEQHPIDMLKIVPSHLAALLTSATEAQASLLLPRRALLLGGDVLTPDLMQCLGQLGGTCQIYNHYGPTEATIGALVNPLGSLEQAARMVSADRSIPLGLPINNSVAYVLDEHLQLLPAGVSGELYLGGAGLARGYLRRPEQTAARFIPHPFSQSGERLYRTGDRARLNFAGQIEFLGRNDHQVKIRGYRVELGEIEAVLKEHAAVGDAVVVWQKGAQEGEEGREEGRLVSYVVARQQPGPAEEELQAFVRGRLPNYMVPQDWMLLPQLPLTANGKVDRQQLPRVEARTYEQERLQVRGPRGPIEEGISEIWRELLERQELDVEDNFFEAGGHSLLATQAVARLRRMLGVELSVLSLFETPTIAGLARQVEQALRAGTVASPAMSRVERRAEGMPLSYAQQRLWLMDQLEPESIAYLLPRVLSLSGKLQIQALDESFRHLCQRHEILHTSFEQDERGEPVQRIHSVELVRLPVLDLSGFSEQERVEVARQLAWQESQQPYDLGQGPLLRLALIRLDAQEHHLLWTMHHIITDAWSTGIFVREVTTLYQALSKGEASPLAPLPIQYADYAVWQRAWLQGEVLDEQLAYWQQQLANLVPLEVPTDHPRPPVQSTRGMQLSFDLPLKLQEQLSALSRQEDVTLFMLLLAAFQVLLMHYSGQQDLAIGTPIANRTRPEIEGLIGFFVNTLVMRGDLSGNPTFIEVLKQVRATALGAYTHQDVPFEMLVERLQPERDLSRTPLFQVMFSLVVQTEGPGAPTGQHSEAPLGPGAHEEASAKFDLELTVLSVPQYFHATLLYNRDLYEPARMQRLLWHYQTLLEGIAAEPHRPVGMLPLLTVAEREWLLTTLTQTQRAVPAHSPLPLLAEQVRRTPERVACSSQEGQLTYQALWARASALAHHLQARGVGPEQVVGVLLQRDLAWLVAMLAIWLADGVYLPLDPAAPQVQVEGILQQGQVRLLLTRRRWLAGLSSVPGAVLTLEEIDEQAAQSPMSLVRGDMLPALSGTQAAYVIYTSGSTGRPKGAMLTHEGLLNHLWAKKETLQVQSEDVLGQTASHCFDISLWQVLTPWLVGGRVHVISQEQVQDVVGFAQSVRQEHISLLEVVPVVLRALLDEIELQDPWEVRWLLVTGEALSSELAQRFLQRGWSGELLNAYGPTECSDDVTHAELRPGESWERRPSAPIGRAIINTQLYLLDRWGELVPAGGEGELYVGGMGVGRGYVGEPARTAESFVPNPFAGAEPGARLYRTGDRCRLGEDGTLEFVRREDQQVKVRGYRIELGEIEAALRADERVEEAVVQVRAVGPRAEKILVAYVQMREGVGEEGRWEEPVREGVRARLPGYMVPVRWMRQRSWPVSANGKIDRKALPEPEETSVGREREIRQEEGWLAEMVSGIWQKVLRREEIGRDENFFELGGHSLLATQLIGQVRKLLGVEVPLRTLFETPTVAGLAQRIELLMRQGAGQPLPPLLAGERPQHLPLSFAQQRLWYLDQLEPHNVAYLVRTALRLQGQLDLAALVRSFAALLQRHESLRTTFQWHGDQPVQVIHPPHVLVLPVVDMQQLNLNERTLQARQLISHDAHQPCDLAYGPLLRVYLFRLSPSEHVLLVTMHHIITDGWSMEVMAREITTFYRSFKDGQPVSLPPLPIHYADFAFWQRQWLQGERLEALVSYWSKQLTGIRALTFPQDAPSEKATRYQGAEEPIHIPSDLAAKLTSLGRQEGASLFMVLLAALQVLLYRYTGQDDIVVGTDIANRQQVETEHLIGFFVNQLLLRSKLSDDLTFRQLLGQVRTTALDAYAHQDLPFEKLVEALRAEQADLPTSLFQVKLLVENESYVVPAPHEALVLQDIVTNPFFVERETVQNDLILRFSPASDGLDGTFTYRTSCFAPATIARMVRHFCALLTSIGAHPDDQVSALEMVSQEEKERERMQKEERKTTTFAKFKTTRPKAQNWQQETLVQIGFFQTAASQVRLISPRQPDLDIVEWASNNQELLESELLKHGVLLLRGFSVTTGAEFERFALTVCTDQINANGEHVPAQDVGQGNLYTPVFYAPEKKLLWHNENSFNYDWPMKILFYCSQPATQGGETPIADSRVVFQRIDPEIREAFTRKGIMYIRNYGGGLGLDWQTIFGTQDKAEVEALCRRTAVDFEWQEGDRLHTRLVRPAVIKHPRTGEWVWWNQATHWHPACLDQETRQALTVLFQRENLPRDCCYGDGSPIEDDVMAAICAVYEDVEVSFPWQQGDILLLDNMLTAHARNPFQGPRKIYVAMGNMLTMNEI